jgi:hypothetical protein
MYVTKDTKSTKEVTHATGAVVASQATNGSRETRDATQVWAQVFSRHAPLVPRLRTHLLQNQPPRIARRVFPRKTTICANQIEQVCARRRQSASPDAQSEVAPFKKMKCSSALLTPASTSTSTFTSTPTTSVCVLSFNQLTNNQPKMYFNTSREIDNDSTPRSASSNPELEIDTNLPAQHSNGNGDGDGDDTTVGNEEESATLTHSSLPSLDHLGACISKFVVRFTDRYINVIIYRYDDVVYVCGTRGRERHLEPIEFNHSYIIPNIPDNELSSVSSISRVVTHFITHLVDFTAEDNTLSALHYVTFAEKEWEQMTVAQLTAKCNARTEVSGRYVHSLDELRIETLIVSVLLGGCSAMG